MRVLAIDASLRNTGAAIVDANNGKPRSLYFGTIHNATSMRSSACLVAIRNWLDTPALTGRGPPGNSRRRANMKDVDVDLQVRWLGRMEFADALALQEEIVAKKREDRSLGDELLLLEHEAVYTIGRTPDKS